MLGDGIKSQITFVSYLMGRKLRCLILNPLQQLHEIGIIYPIYNEGGRALRLTDTEETSVRLLCLVNGGAGIKT